MTAAGAGLRVVVLISGTGSLLKSLIEACSDPGFPAEVVAVGSDRHDVAGLEVASAAGIPSFVVPFGDFDDRGEWDDVLRQETARWSPDLVVSAGFMRLLGETFLSGFPGAVLNTHPALLPAFPGAHAVADALAYGVRVTGCTVHFVDSGMDTGPVVAQEPVPVYAGDDEASLHERIKTRERTMLTSVVRELANGWHIDGRSVVLGGNKHD